jgi:hypothetical protein
MMVVLVIVNQELAIENVRNSSFVWGMLNSLADDGLPKGA